MKRNIKKMGEAARLRGPKSLCNRILLCQRLDFLAAQRQCAMYEYDLPDDMYALIRIFTLQLFLRHHISDSNRAESRESIFPAFAV